MMDMPQLVWTIIFAVGFVQGGFMSVMLLLLKGGNRPAMRMLSLLVACAALMIGEELLTVTRWDRQWPHVIGSTMLLPLVMGPAGYLYSLLLTRRRRLKRIEYFHFLPLPLLLIAFVPFYILPAPDKMEAIRGGIFLTDPKFIGLLVFKAIHLFFYFFLTLYVLTKRLREANNSTRNPALRTTLRWNIRVFQFTIATVALMYVILVMQMSGINVVPNSDYVGSLILAMLIYVLAFVAVRDPASLTEGVSDLPGRVDASTFPYKQSTLDAEQKEAYLQSLLIYMERAKPFTNPDLRLDDVAEAINMTPHHLSQTINELLDVNFNTFINSYRVDEVKQKITDPGYAHLKILALAYDSGFNSKTSFNRIFKQFTGVTPTSYRKRIHQHHLAS